MTSCSSSVAGMLAGSLLYTCMCMCKRVADTAGLQTGMLTQTVAQNQSTPCRVTVAEMQDALGS